MNTQKWYSGLRIAVFLLGTAVLAAIGARPAAAQQVISNEDSALYYDDWDNEVWLDAYVQMTIWYCTEDNSEVDVEASTSLDYEAEWNWAETSAGYDFYHNGQYVWCDSDDEVGSPYAEVVDYFTGQQVNSNQFYEVDGYHEVQFEGEDYNFYDFTDELSASGYTDDATPAISIVSPSVWPGGATTSVTLTGSGFGTNAPGLSVTGVVLDGQPMVTSYNDSQIVFSITVDANDPGNTASIVVTSNGYGANGFLSAPNGGSSAASPPASARVAVPVNFRLYGAPTDVGAGQLMFFYKWDSSTGNSTDLSTCAVYEVVTYGDGHSPFYWPSPPWNTFNNNPTVIYTQGSDMGFDDTQLNGNNSWTKPYQYKSFSATQYFKYSCNGPSEHTLIGPITITRTVSQNGDSTWKYQVTKSGYSDSLSPLP